MAGKKKRTSRKKDQTKPNLLKFATKLGHNLRKLIEIQISSDAEKMIKAGTPAEAMYYYGRISSLLDLLDDSGDRYGFTNLIFTKCDVRIIPKQTGV